MLTGAHKHNHYTTQNGPEACIILIYMRGHLQSITMVAMQSEYTCAKVCAVFYSLWAKGFNLMEIHKHSAAVYGESMFTIQHEQA